MWVVWDGVENAFCVLGRGMIEAHGTHSKSMEENWVS